MSRGLDGHCCGPCATPPRWRSLRRRRPGTCVAAPGARRRACWVAWAALAQTAGIEHELARRGADGTCSAALTIAEQQQRAVTLGTGRSSPRALAELDGPVLLLKGAAYAAAGLPPARGRLFSDIDLPGAEGADRHGRGGADARWLGHEQPPQRLRPALLPAVDARAAADDAHPAPDRAGPAPQHPAGDGTHPDPAGPDPGAAPRTLPDHPRFAIPAPADLVLHSATHLFHEGEWQHGLRDLVDLDALLRQRGEEPGFWDRTARRAPRY